jgi:hypothetical membrane protein
MITCSIYIAYFMFLLIGAIMLIMGVSKRDHTKMILFMIVITIGVFMGFLQIVSTGVNGVSVGGKQNVSCMIIFLKNYSFQFFGRCLISTFSCVSTHFTRK